MLNELDKLFDMLSEIENKLTDLERINSMVIVTCDACENGNDIKYDVSNVMMLIEDQIDMVEETIRSNVSKCNDLTRNIQETIKKWRLSIWKNYKYLTMKNLGVLVV